MIEKNVLDLLASLSNAEKAALTAGGSMWAMQGVERLNIPALKVTDGPNGARGSGIFGIGKSSACFPCGSALGATWDPGLVERIGVAIGEEAKTKSCAVLLAPTVNLHRSPLYGRNFECFSEDPHLSGRLAVAYVRGVQSQNIACVVKHFVANDAEFERMTVNSIVDERTLREIYLPPFEAAVREAGIWGVMTAYNRLNGTPCTAHDWLLRDLLKGEWEFDGVVMTDWFSFVDTVASPRAGLDIEMPGPARMYGPPLAAAVEDGRVDSGLLDEQAGRVLRLIDRVRAFAAEPSGEEREVDLPEHRALLREAATESIVLLKNRSNILPLEDVGSVALIGHNAGRLQLFGGGSAQLRPHYHLDLRESLQGALGTDVRIEHEPGLWVGKFLPLLEAPDLISPGGEPGLLIEYLADDGAVLRTQSSAQSQVLAFPAAGESAAAIRASGSFEARSEGTYQISLAQAGGARVSVDGRVVIDGIADQLPPGDAFLGFGSIEKRVDIELTAGRHELGIEFGQAGGELIQAARVGVLPPQPPDLLERAATLARSSDAAVVVVGTNEDYETEGRDRPDMALPDGQDDLIRAVIRANPNTVVVINSASPVDMDWDGEAAAVLQCWFGGQELANALADVLSGKSEPGGRLPTSIPLRLEHSPSYGNFPGENGQVRYGEGLLMGYRHFDTRELPVRYRFGHGLSYTSFALGSPQITERGNGGRMRVAVKVTNTGRRAGSEVVQAYVEPPAGPLFRPRRELRAFDRVKLAAGATGTAVLEFDDRSFSYWDPDAKSLAAPGRHSPDSLRNRDRGDRARVGCEHRSFMTQAPGGGPAATGPRPARGPGDALFAARRRRPNPGAPVRAAPRPGADGGRDRRCDYQRASPDG